MDELTSHPNASYFANKLLEFHKDGKTWCSDFDFRWTMHPDRFLPQLVDKNLLLSKKTKNGKGSYYILTKQLADWCQQVLSDTHE